MLPCQKACDRYCPGCQRYFGREIAPLLSPVMVGHQQSFPFLQNTEIYAVGVLGHAENIRVISIVGRFLEHSRIYLFGTEERRNIYITSADFMTRNTLRRVEVAAPILDKELCHHLAEMFQVMLADNRQARELRSNGEYTRVQNRSDPLDAQAYFYQEAYRATEQPEVPQTAAKRGTGFSD